ncbi:MAG: DUF3891 family protein [Anaerolineae bacterium]|nr:DUF3891 family protein [Anaerolineae bacterium]
MIRREETTAMWVIRQAAHATISGQIAAHWLDRQYVAAHPREELLMAAYCHDAGWALVDAQPRINAAGLPRTFTEMDLSEHFTIWQRSIQSVFAQNRYAGLLTSLHCTALYDQRLVHIDDPPADRARIHDFLDTQHAWEHTLIAALSDHPRYALAVQPAVLQANLRLLQVWDFLSLLLCMSEVPERSLDNVPLLPGQHTVLQVAPDGPRHMVLHPFPLEQPLTVWIDAQQVIGGPFDTDAALQNTLSQTPYRPMVFELGPH